MTDTPKRFPYGGGPNPSLPDRRVEPATRQKPVRTLSVRCPQCRARTTATGRTTADAALAEHAHLTEPGPCRFAGSTIDDARAGLTVYARQLLTRRAESDAATKDPGITAEVAAALPQGFRGLIDPELDDDDHEAEERALALAGERRAVALADAGSVEWVGREGRWTGWECDCPIKGKAGPAGHYRASMPGPPPLLEAIGPAPRHPKSGFRIMIAREIEVGYGAGTETIVAECPTWRPVKRTDVRNPRGGLLGTKAGPKAGKSAAELRVEARTVLAVHDVQVITTPAHLKGGPAALWRDSARCVRSAWGDAKGEHVTVGLVGHAERSDGPVRWWAYWTDGRFDGAFWGGWPVKVGELKSLISGELPFPPKPDPGAPKVQRKTAERAPSARRKFWVGD